MERIADITLVKITYETDAIGQEIEDEEATRTLTATLHGISRQEWAMAAQTGLNPQGMAFLRDSADYDNEDLLELDGVRYGIYRTYPTEDGGIELYYRRNIGVNARGEET
jgi:SPP1 family predicted phage head-tail adaptor